jgi:TPR repeat protein
MGYCLTLAQCHTDCAARRRQACLREGFIRYNGWLVPADREGAKKLLRAECDHDDADACSGYIDMVKDGEGIDEAVRAELGGKAERLYTAACEAKDAYACMLLYKSNRGPDDQGPLKKACAAGSAVGCAMVEALSPREDGSKVAPATVKAAAEACHKGDPDACEAVLGLSQEGDPGVAEAVQTYVKLRKAECDAGWPWSCHDLAKVYEATKDVAGAAAARKRECDIGDKEGCQTTD